MNYYQARQRKGDMLWHYTCMNDGRIWPVGPCADGCPGHATKEEANEHYRQGILDSVKFQPAPEWPKYKCERDGCDEPATMHAIFPGQIGIHCLCAAHANREGLAPLVSVGEMISS